MAPTRAKAKTPQQHPNLQRALEQFRAGDLTAAARLATPILERTPDDVTALHLMGMIAYRRQELGSAETLLQRARDLAPDNAGLLNDLGTVLTQAEKYVAAERALVRALELVPGMPGFHLNLGNVYKAMAMYEAAEEQVRAAIYHKHDYAEAYRVLSEILSEDGRAEEAIDMASRAARLAPKDPRSHVRLGESLNAADRISEARAAFEAGVRLAPDSIRCVTAFGEFLTERGFLDEAAALMRNLLDRFPDSTQAHSILARTISFTHYDAQMAHMESLLEREGVPERERALLHFGLAKAYEDIKDYHKALAHSLAGNAISRKEKAYSAAAADREFDALQAAFTPELLARHGDVGHKDGTPVFVLGMPRSGTTLTEQILASHPRVHGAGELTLLGALVRELRTRLDARDDVELVGKASADDWRRLGEDYVTRVRRLAPGAGHIVDKMPENFRYLGHIRLALPNAKVVYCRRLAPDNCVSIFNIRFVGSGLGYGYDLGELGHYYRRHAELMAHWGRLMPGFFVTNQYEDLVADQAAQSRRLLDFCGLEWDESVLAFFDNERSVRTASKAQVRRPIYTSSIGRYQRYGAQLQPLLDALGWDEQTQSLSGMPGP